MQQLVNSITAIESPKDEHNGGGRGAFYFVVFDDWVFFIGAPGAADNEQNKNDTVRCGLQATLLA